jgi:competence protein ComEA
MRERRIEARSRLTAVAAARLDRLSRQWRPVPPVPPEPASVAEPKDSWAMALDDDAVTGGRPAARSHQLTVGPWNASAWRGLALVLCAAIAVSAWWWWSGRPREAVAAPVILSTGAPVTGMPRADVGTKAVPTPAVSQGAQVVVHVVGQVKHPGVVTLPLGSRVGDAVEAVGGVTKKGADDSVNLARVLADGEQVIVGFAAQAVAGVLGIAPTVAGALVSLNTADAAALELLPGVGPVLAQRIVQWRTTNGPFRSVDELGEVSGIGDAIMSQLRPLVTV